MAGFGDFNKNKSVHIYVICSKKGGVVVRLLNCIKTTLCLSYFLFPVFLKQPIPLRGD
jgi:hypothetical protein